MFNFWETLEILPKTFAVIRYFFKRLFFLKQTKQIAETNSEKKIIDLCQTCWFLFLCFFFVVHTIKQIQMNECSSTILFRFWRFEHSCFYFVWFYFSCLKCNKYKWRMFELCIVFFITRYFNVSLYCFSSNYFKRYCLDLTLRKFWVDEVFPQIK